MGESPRIQYDAVAAIKIMQSPYHLRQIIRLKIIYLTISILRPQLGNIILKADKSVNISLAASRHAQIHSVYNRNPFHKSLIHNHKNIFPLFLHIQLLAGILLKQLVIILQLLVCIFVVDSVLCL